MPESGIIIALPRRNDLARGMCNVSKRGKYNLKTDRFDIRLLIVIAALLFIFAPTKNSTGGGRPFPTSGPGALLGLVLGD